MNANYGGPSGMYSDQDNGSAGPSSSDASSGGPRPKLPHTQYAGNGGGSADGGQNNKGGMLMDYQRPQYSLPGVLHYLQHEWSRYELDRAQWEVERAELQARAAFLQGERKSQESLKVDLVRRIKMLELALRQERQKFARYKLEVESGGSVNDEDVRLQNEKNEGLEALGYGDYVRDNAQNMVAGLSWKEGRQTLRQYLKEIGYADTLINAQAARVTALLSATGRKIQPMPEPQNAIKGNGVVKSPDLVKDRLPKSVMDNALLAAENALSATFDYLNSDGVPRSPAREDAEENEENEEDNSNSFDNMFQRGRPSRKTIVAGRPPPKSESNEDMATGGDGDTEAALKEFDFLPTEEGGGEARSVEGEENWANVSMSNSLAKMKEEFRNEQKDRRGGGGHRPKKSHLQDMLNNLNKEGATADLTSPNVAPDPYPRETQLPDTNFLTQEAANEATSFGLGELAALTVNNDSESGPYDASSNTREGPMHKSWSTKHTLRSHFDGVRSLAFHPEDLMLMTASDDGTLKYWNLFRNWNGNKKASSVDFEPVYTFRGHVGPVLSSTMTHNGEYCVSGGEDGTVRFWNLSCTTGDPYEAYDPAIVGPIMRDHSDAVWHLRHHPTHPIMVSTGADAKVFLYDTEKLSVLTELSTGGDRGIATSSDFFHNDANKMTLSFEHQVAVLDIETGKTVVQFKIPDNAEDYVYRVVNHPSLPVAITAHEDREVRFFDTNTGEMVTSMVAHLDAVSCLAVDPNGLYLITGSHDSSVRFWSMHTKTCLQENTVHRKKLDESVYDVTFHPSKNHVASAGADGVAKVYT